MERFIYVFEPAARDRLLRAGFILLKSDERNAIWVFDSERAAHFALSGSDIAYVMSDTLTF